MNVDELINQLIQQKGTIGLRANKLVEYQNQFDKGQLSNEEYRELVLDLARIDQVSASAEQLEQIILLKKAVELILSISRSA